MYQRAALAVLLAVSTLAFSACNRSPPPASPAAVPAGPTIFETMAQTFMPQANKFWELTGNLYDDNGALSAARLSDPQWQELSAAATSMRDVAKSLAAATTLRVAPDGVKLQNDGTPEALGVAQIQALIDADPQGFRDEAAKLVTVAGQAIAAAAARDAVKADDASNRLNEVCTACHTRFWYPEPAAQ